MGLVGGRPGEAADGAQGQAGSSDHARVLSTAVDGSITPVMAIHVGDVVSRGEKEDYDAVVIELDTPGGLDTSMRDIVQQILGADVPVVVYVSPEGARAASAGAIITFAAHVAALSPGTAIGAATPVDLASDEDLSDSDRKAINDAAAFAESLAELRDRNTEFAGDTVREGRSASANEALDIGAVDTIAASLPELLDDIDGQVVEVGPDDEAVTLRTGDAVVDEAEMGVFRQIQQVLADPNLAFLFLSLGTLGIIFELANPGIGGAGIVGVILIILAFFALAVLPVNAVGLLALGVAGALFVAELFVPGIGVAAAGGTAALVLSGIFLFRDEPGFEVSFWVIAPIALVVGGAVILAGRLVMRSRGQPSTTTGSGLFVGHEVDVELLEPGRGRAFIEGAWWRVRSRGTVLAGGRARIVDLDGLTLIVEPTDSPEPTDSAEPPDSRSAK